MNTFNSKPGKNNKWIVCEGDALESCAGEWNTKEEADGVAEMLNEASA